MGAAKAPCGQNCQDRTADPNCHMTCQRYLEWKAELGAAKDRERAAREADHVVMEGMVRTAKRVNGRKSYTKYIRRNH